MKQVILIIIVGFWVVCSFGFKQPHSPTPYQYPDLRFFPPMVATNNPPTLEGIELGRFLFYDPILSKDSTISCAGCHQQKHAFADANTAFSKGVNGTLSTRNTMPLFNLNWYSSLFWDGKANSLEEQALLPVRTHDEMDLDWETAAHRIGRNSLYPPLFKKAFGSKQIDSTTITKAIAQFERSLISHQSKYDRVIRGEAYYTKQEYEGFNLVNDQTKGNCLQCHTTDADRLGTTTKFSNNGLDAFMTPDDFTDKGLGGITGEPSDIGRFRIPSLRNVGVTAPYMHDGRFKTLEEVLAFYRNDVNVSLNIDPKMEVHHMQQLNLTDYETDCIIAFLHTLTDSVFISNPDFSNPFDD